MGVMQFNIIIVSGCIYLYETVNSLSSEYVTCVLICIYIEDSITMVVKYTIKEISQVIIIFITIMCIIIIHSTDKYQHYLSTFKSYIVGL
jgi:hypothetical protein